MGFGGCFYILILLWIFLIARTRNFLVTTRKLLMESTNSSFWSMVKDNLNEWIMLTLYIAVTKSFHWTHRCFHPLIGNDELDNINELTLFHLYLLGSNLFVCLCSKKWRICKPTNKLDEDNSFLCIHDHQCDLTTKVREGLCKLLCFNFIRPTWWYVRHKKKAFHVVKSSQQCTNYQPQIMCKYFNK